MKAALALVLALAASPVEAKPWQCVLWPKTCQLDRAPGDVEPLPQRAPAPAAPVAPSIAQPTPAPRAAPVPAAKKASAPKRIKLGAPKKKKVALPWWCARVPAGTPLWMVKSAAVRELNRPLTPAEEQQARDCIASKR